MNRFETPASRTARSWTVGLLLATTAIAAMAERADRNQPMQIESDALRYEDRTQQSTFTGNVVVTKGTIVLRGARLEVRQDNAGHQSGTMFSEPGKLAFFREKRDGVNEFIEGKAETIEYDSQNDTVRLLRRAEMRRLAGATPLDEVMGSVIVYNNRTEVYTVDGSPRAAGAPSAAPGGRVRAILAPRNAASASEPAVPLKPSTTLAPAGTSQ